MRVLVTGCGGFVGRHVASYLAAHDFEVYAAYRRTPAAVITRPNVFPIVGSFEDSSPLPRTIDAVAHIGATSPQPGITDDQIVADNVISTRAGIAYAQRAGARCFVFASSMSVYGDISVNEVDEDTPRTDPDVYGVTKYLGEQMLREAQGSLPGLAIRLPGVLGRGAARNFLSGALARLRLDQAIVAFNPDAPFNNAAYVDDLGRLISGVLRRGVSGYDVITVAARGMTTISAALERLREGMGSRSKIEFRPSERHSFTVSIARAVERHGYDPMDINDLLDRYMTDELGTSG